MSIEARAKFVIRHTMTGAEIAFVIIGGSVVLLDDRARELMGQLLILVAVFAAPFAFRALNNWSNSPSEPVIDAAQSSAAKK